MRKTIIYTLIVWTFIIFVIHIMNIYSSNFAITLTIHIIWNLYLSIAPILGILLLDNKNYKKFFLIAYSLLLLIVLPFEYYIFNLVLEYEINGNITKILYEKQLSWNKYFTIYKTPDDGALGGLYTMYSIDRKLPFGIVMRSFLDHDDFKINDKPNGYMFIIYKNDTMIVKSSVLN